MSAFPKVLAVIRSCKTPQQIKVAERMMRNFLGEEWRKLFLKHPMSVTFLDTRRLNDMSRELSDESGRMLALIDSSSQNKGAT